MFDSVAGWRGWAKDLGLLSIVGAVVLPWIFSRIRRHLASRREEKGKVRIDREMLDETVDAVIILLENAQPTELTGNTLQIHGRRVRVTQRIEQALATLVRCREEREKTR